MTPKLNSIFFIRNFALPILVVFFSVTMSFAQELEVPSESGSGASAIRSSSQNDPRDSRSIPFTIDLGTINDLNSRTDLTPEILAAQWKDYLLSATFSYGKMALQSKTIFTHDEAMISMSLDANDLTEKFALAIAEVYAEDLYDFVKLSQMTFPLIKENSGQARDQLYDCFIRQALSDRPTACEAQVRNLVLSLSYKDFAALRNAYIRLARIGRLTFIVSKPVLQTKRTSLADGVNMKINGLCERIRNLHGKMMSELKTERAIIYPSYTLLNGPAFQNAQTGAREVFCSSSLNRFQRQPR